MPLTSRALLVAGALATAATVAAAQDPVIKPTATTTTLSRLPAPTGIRARQLPDGRILVTWAPVAEAVSYAIWRTVPPAGIVALPTRPTDTLYYDADVHAGSYYYYTLAAVSGDGTVGLKAGTSPVLAQTSATATAGATSLASPSGVNAVLSNPPTSAWVVWALKQPQPVDVVIAFERGVTPSAGGTPSWTTVARSAMVPAGTVTNANYYDAFGTLPAGTSVTYRVRTVSADNTLQSAPVLTNPLVIPGSTTTTSASSAAAGTAASVTVTVGPSVAVTVGGTSSLATVGGSGARWVSMNESVATVDASGTVTGRAGGTAQVVALAAASDGSLRVTAVHVSVTP